MFDFLMFDFLIFDVGRMSDLRSQIGDLGQLLAH
jgi:hypothetical protein